MPKLKFSLPGDERYNTLMSVVALLQREGEMHIDELAEHFAVPRKVMRSMLSTLNTTSFKPRYAEEQIPFYIDVERIDEEDGIVSLQLDSTPQRLPRITQQQSAALLAGLHYLQSIPDFGESHDVEELIALLSHDQKEIQSISLEPGQFDSDLAIIKRAILHDKRISCRYVNGKGEESNRFIDPLILISSEDHWYLRGYCLTHNEIRTFRLDHMVEAEILDISRCQEAHAAAKTLDDSAPIYNPSNGDTDVVLELAPEAYALAGYFNQLHEPTKSGDENITVTIKVGFLPDLGPMVCRFGSNAKVVSPPEAREVVRRFAEQALANSKLELETE